MLKIKVLHLHHYGRMSRHWVWALGIALSLVIPVGLKKIFFVQLYPFYSQSSSKLDGKKRDGTTNETALSLPEDYRFSLLAALDLLIKSEQVLQKESGSFTKALDHVPFFLGFLPRYYQIEVSKASRNELMLSAKPIKMALEPEVSMISEDRLSVDQDFRVRSNFVLPVPPKSYLQMIAKVALNRIQAMSHVKKPDHRDLSRFEGIFSGFFKYEFRMKKRTDEVTGLEYEVQTIVAVGEKAPVQGEVVEMDPDADPYVWVQNYLRDGFLKKEIALHLEKILMAQKIRNEVVGAYTGQFEKLVSTSESLEALIGENDFKPLRVQEFQLDPHFGFHAEVSGKIKSSAIQSNWAVNALGQITEISTMESLVGQVEQARRKLANIGEEKPSVSKSIWSESPQKGLPAQEEPTHSPLMIDFLGSENSKK